jgi:hypothetical protein
METTLLAQDQITKHRKTKPTKPNLVSIIFKHLVLTSKKTQHFAITRMDWLMPFKEIVADCHKNNSKKTILEQNAKLQIIK